MWAESCHVCFFLRKMIVLKEGLLEKVKKLFWFNDGKSSLPLPQRSSGTTPFSNQHKKSAMEKLLLFKKLFCCWDIFFCSVPHQNSLKKQRLYYFIVPFVHQECQFAPRCENCSLNPRPGAWNEKLVIFASWRKITYWLIVPESLSLCGLNNLSFRHDNTPGLTKRIIFSCVTFLY